jgi:serine protease Do
VRALLSDGRKLTPAAVLTGPTAEVAVLRLRGDRPFPFAEFGDSDKVRVGDRVLSLDLLFRRELAAERGVISGRVRAEEKGGELLLMDSARSYPSDRDLLFDREGKLLGAWAGEAVVPSKRVKAAVRQLLKG